MTTVSQIITDAFRQSNLIAVAASPTSDEQTEALRYLNRIVKSVFGMEAGENLVAFPLGDSGISRPSGYPWWGSEEPSSDWFVPENTRLMLNLTAPLSIYLHPDPDDGARFAVEDVAGNLATYNVTVYGNGRLVDGSTSVTLSTNSTSDEWFYRADTATWSKYTSLDLVDTFPFPEEFDDFFITMLALRLNPSYGSSIDPQTQALFNRSLKQVRARYVQTKPARSELALLRLSLTAADRDRWSTDVNFYSPEAMFNKGWPY